jgi:hypothetical protein
MLRWETVDLKATYPFERYRAVSGNREYRIFHDPEARQFLPSILVVRELREDDVHVHIHHGTYRTDDEAKQAARQWEGPPREG